VPRRGYIDVLLISCPHCGARDQTEFAYGGDATVVRPAADAPLEAWFAYVYLRDNPAGPHAEYWQHVAGCRRWIRIRRDTVTHEIT
jgi:methylglutamate dehydrogenase subunit B